jgi:threonine aldolase
LTVSRPRPAIDLRSDTVTKPSAEMRRAMAEAEVGDDVLDGDPTVKRLEDLVARILGKEAALFVPSGVMANQIALRRHCAPGNEVILDRGSHVLNYESGAAHALAGVGFYVLDGERGILEPDEVRRAIRPAIPHLPKTALIFVENSHNFAGGSVWPLETLEAVRQVAREAGLPIHLDGARIWNASVASGETPARIASCADSISVGMSKGLGAPVGSLLAGTKEFIRGSWTLRKQMGGGMRQSGILAAGCIFGLEHNLRRLAEDHSNARLLAESIATIPGVTVDLEATQTNIVFFDVAGTGRTAADVEHDCQKAGVRVLPFGPTLLRAVTHLDVNRGDILRAAEVLEHVIGGGGRRASASGKRATAGAKGRGVRRRGAAERSPAGRARSGGRSRGGKGIRS